MKRLVCSVLAAAALLFAAPVPALANAAEPPAVVVLVPDPPDDLSLVLLDGAERIEPRRTERLLEHTYAFYPDAWGSGEGLMLSIETAGQKTKLALPAPAGRYRNTYTLLTEGGGFRLLAGKTALRDARLVAVRVVLTLAVEALVLLAFGYRRRRTWRLFLAINLATQGLLNAWLGGQGVTGGYLIFSLIVGEVLVFAVEGAAFLALVREHSRRRTFLFVLVANAASLYAGYHLIRLLPV